MKDAQIPYNPNPTNPIDEYAEIKLSDIHGLGLFAKKLIPKGLLTYSYYERDLDSLIFCLDNSRFVNHSFNANSGASKDENGFCAAALRDIQPGEEITEDYSKYTLCSWLKKYKEYFDPCCW